MIPDDPLIRDDPLIKVSAPVVPTEFSRLKLRLEHEIRRRVSPARKRLKARFRVPGLESIRKYLVIRSAVVREVRRGLPRSGIARSPDAVYPSSIPSAAAGLLADRVLAEIDQDGFAWSLDPMDVSFFNRRAEKLPRIRYRAEIVLHRGDVCFRKQFLRQSFKRGVRSWFWSLLGFPFYNEAAALLRLQGLAGVPEVTGIDTRTKCIYLTYIEGFDLRHRLAQEGFTIHDLDLANDPATCHLSNKKRDRREVEIFRLRLAERYRKEVKTLAFTIAGRGVAPHDVKYGNVIVGAKTGALYWVDFESAYLGSDPHWYDKLDHSYALINERFGTDFITSDAITAYEKSHYIYSPVDFGHLGFLGHISDVQAGEGRWRWLLKDLTGWRGKRILDLGSNNGLYALRELQAGATEVHCVERDRDAFAQAQFVRAATEQIDNRNLNVRMHNTDMKSFLESSAFEEGYFDIAMALCSIYYLEREDIAACMKIIARIAKQCWLQANVHTPRESIDLQERASVEFLAYQLRAAGFDRVRLIAPKDYSRPLLIGTKTV